MATLAALPDGSTLTFPRLQSVLDLTSGNLISHLRKLQDAGYIASQTTRGNSGKSTRVELTTAGRAAYVDYRDTLRSWLD